MRVFMLSDANNVHTKRWVKALNDNGVDIILFSLTTCNDSFYSGLKRVVLDNVNFNVTRTNGAISKLKYITIYFKLKNLIRKTKPDILHAHYASSYGLIGALMNFHPFIISLWGSDVYSFPKVSFFHKLLFKFNLVRADYIMSTSNCMALEASKYTKKDIFITPFGVDTEIFKSKNNQIKSTTLLIGTIKTLSDVYGIDLLIRSFDLIQRKRADLDLQLAIVGDGIQRKSYEKLVKELNIDNKVKFYGQISNDKVPEFLNQFSIFVALSREESFGVAAVEALACECPVVLSDVDGFKEIIGGQQAGYLVPSNDFYEAALKIEELLNNKSLARLFSLNGRKLVIRKYKWEENVKTVMKLYNDIITINARS